MEKFDEDLDSLAKRLCANESDLVIRELQRLKATLVFLHQKNLVKINHSVMELTCAKYLITHDYDVSLEQVLDGISCDLYALKGFGAMIVEIETGFVPPEHALEPATYCKARIASKITRYSGYAEKFVLAAPPHYAMPIHPALIKPPRFRHTEEIKEIKVLCDQHYSQPPVNIEEIKNARLHAIYILDVDTGTIRETDPISYFEKNSDNYPEAQESSQSR